MDKIRYAFPYLLIALLGALLFLPGLGQLHLFDWDEINFAESAREMLLTGNYAQVQIDFKPFDQKPPLFIWMQALSMSLFGINEFAARSPNALCGIITLLVLFHIGTKYVDVRMALLWIVMYIGSFLPHFYFKSGIIDPWFNLFMFLAIWQWATLGQQGRWQKVLLSGVFIGLAVLTKGPVGLLLPLLCLVGMSIVKRTFTILTLREWLAFIIVFITVTFAWYGMETMRNGIWFLQEFIIYQWRLLTTGEAGHGGPFYYHFIVLLIGCFPASFFVFKSLYKVQGEQAEHKDLRLWMIALLVVVVVVFSIVKTKIVHYSSLAYFPITYLAANYVYRLLFAKQVTWQPAIGRASLLVGMLLAVAFFFTPLLAQNIYLLKPYVNDAFALGNLEKYVQWPMYLILVGVVYAFVIVTAFLSLRYEDFQQGVVVLFLGTAFIIQLLMYTFVPRIEDYTQRTAIDFYKSIAGEDAYVEVLDFKSFAHLFYTEKQPVTNRNSYDKDWLLHGEIDKPVYFVVKNIHADKYRELSSLKVIQDKHGFVMFKREPF